MRDGDGGRGRAPPTSPAGGQAETAVGRAPRTVQERRAVPQREAVLRADRAVPVGRRAGRGACRPRAAAVPVPVRAQRLRPAGRPRRDRPGERDRRARLPHVRPPVASGRRPSGRGSERAGQVSRAVVQGQARGPDGVRRSDCRRQRHAVVRGRRVLVRGRRRHADGAVRGGAGQAGGTAARARRGRGLAGAPFPDGRAGRREAHVAARDGTGGTGGRALPRRLQPQQRDVPVRRRRAAGGRAAVRHGHRAVRVARARPVVLPVHEHGPQHARRPLGPAAGRVLRGAGRRLVGRGAGGAGAGPRAAGRGDARPRVLRAGARVVLRARHAGGRRGRGPGQVPRRRLRPDVQRAVVVRRRRGHRRGRRRRATFPRHQLRRRARYTLGHTHAGLPSRFPLRSSTFVICHA